MKLSNASWIIPLLQARMEGKTIQTYYGGKWNDWGSDYITFDSDMGQKGYRVKPEVLKYRRFLATCLKGPGVGITYTDDYASSTENASYFIRWIDTEWQEVEL